MNEGRKGLEMKIDELSDEQQETATYCHSCGEVRSEDELGICLDCGASICGLKECSSGCFCGDAKRELGLSVSGDVLSPVYADAYISHLDGILLDIDRALSNLGQAIA
jgi:hypothetical protein